MRMSIRLFVSLLALILSHLVSAESLQNDQGTSASLRQFDHIEQFFIVGSGYKEYQGSPAIWVGFSKPIDGQQDLADYFELSNILGLVAGGWIIDALGTNAYFPNVQASTQYELTVSQHIKSADGISLDTALHKTIKTPKIEPGASFIHSGAILNPAMSEGLPILAVNVDYVDVDFYRIAPQQYLNSVIRKATANTSSYRIDNLIKHAKLAFSRKYQTKGKRNQKQRFVLSTQSAEALHEPGIYLAVMRVPGQYQRYDTAYFNVSQIGIEARKYKNEHLVTLFNQNTGQPKVGVAVEVLDGKGEKIGNSLTTNQFGQVSIAHHKDVRLVAVAQGNEFNVLALTSSQQLDLRDFSVQGRQSQPYDLFVWGARDLYRRAEQIDYYALLRNQDGMPVGDVPIELNIIAPNGKTLSTRTLNPSDSHYHFTYKIAEDAITGPYRLQFKFGKQVFKHVFQVEDFMPERLEMEFVQPLEWLPQFGEGQQAMFGKYLYGAPASGNKVDGHVILQTTNQALANQSGYYFGQVEKLGVLKKASLAKALLDGDGAHTFYLKNIWRKYQSALQLTGYVNVYESAGRKVTDKFQQIWWPHNTMLGIKPAFEKLTAEQNSQANFSLIRADNQGELVDDEINVEVIRHHIEYSWQRGRHGAWERTETKQTYPVWQKSLVLNKTAPLDISVPVEWGKYQLLVTSKTDGRKSSLFFTAGQGWYRRWAADNGNDIRPDQIKIAFDKAMYKQGERAQVKVFSPYAGHAQVKIESDQLLWQNSVALVKGENQLEVPIGDWQQHNVYLSVYQIAPAQDGQGLRRAIGVQHLVLDRSARQLEVQLTAPAKIEPEQNVVVNVTVPNATQNTKVVVAAVDVGILNLHDFKTPSPDSFYFGQRAYEVEIRDNFSRIIQPNRYANADILWGGGAELAHGGKQARAQVQIVSYISPPVALDQTQQAAISLPIPYFNGRLRLMAVAFNDEQYGAADSQITVADKLVTQIGMPRFLAVGDSAQISLDMTNMTDKKMDLRVNLTATDLQAEPVKQTVSLGANEKRVLQLNVRANQFTDNAHIGLLVTSLSNNERANISEPLRIDRNWPISIRYAYPAERYSESFTLAAKQQHQFELRPKDWQPDIESSISLAQRPEFNLSEQVSRLYRFPLGCLEQTSSRLYPWLALPPNQRHQLQSFIKDLNVDEVVTSGVDRILSMGTGTGALSLWRNGAEHAWLTVYATDILITAQQAGYFVAEDRLTVLYKKLAQYLRGGSIFDGYGDIPHYRFATRSYAAYVLAKLNKANLGHMRKLTKLKDNANSPYAMIQLAAAFKLMGDSRQSRDMLRAAKNKRFNNRYASDYSSVTRDKAATINLLLQHDLDKGWAQRLAFNLWNGVQGRTWFSTQERLALVLADIALAEHFSGQFNYQLSVAGQQFTGPDESSAFYRLDGMSIAGSQLLNQSNQDLYVTRITQGYPLNPPKPISQGVDVTRVFYSIDGKPMNIATDKITSGDRFIVRLSVSADQVLRDLMLVDLLPAGFEIENAELNQLVDLQSLKLAGKSIQALMSKGAIDYQSSLDDRFVAAINVSKYRATEIFYVVQAVTVGQYILPPSIVESMYQPDIKAIGSSEQQIEIVAD
ncbi:alpha-2-macroglobulin family protein [Saccharobesus litoralis]|nr:MG2 domain-containing protein [Saccharobesus litoralis]